jgi:tight adherence protein C
MIPVIGAISAFVAVAAFLLWVTGLRSNAAEARLGQLATGLRPGSFEAPFGDRVMLPIVGGIVGFFINLMPHSWVQRISRQLLAAGSPMTTGGFFTVVMITGVMCPFSFLAFVGMAGGEIDAVIVMLTLLFAGIGILLPVFMLRTVVSSRRQKIWRQLADAFDLITVCVEAGLGLDAALRQVAEKLRGPLSDEIAQVLREVGMGRPRREALEDMAARTQVRELETFVHAVIQAEQLGTSLGRVLRAQALSLRVRRRQRAQEIARKAPVKLVFPLVLLIMPTFFIITLGPVGVRFYEYISE